MQSCFSRLSSSRNRCLLRSGSVPAPAWASKNRASLSPTSLLNLTPRNRIRLYFRKLFAMISASAASSISSARVFYPASQPGIPSELKYVAWTDSPVNAHFVAFGNLVETTGEVAIQAWFYDVTNPSSQAVIAKIYRGAPTDPQVRKFAHQFADEIITTPFRRTSRHLLHSNRLRQFAQWRQRNLGHGLRRRQPARAHFFALDFADAALGTR